MWFRLGFRRLSPYFFGILFHHHFLAPARVPGLVSLLFWNPVPSSFLGYVGFRGLSPYSLASCSIIISWFRLRFRGLSPTLLASCSIIISWFRLGFRDLSPYSSGTLFHHPFLVPARVPGLVAQTALELNGVLNSFKKQFCSTGIFGFRVFYSILAFCSIIISLVLLFRVGFQGLSPQSSGILFHLHFLVPGRVPGIVSLLFWNPVPSSFLGYVVPARVPALVSLLFWHPVPSSFLGSG